MFVYRFHLHSTSNKNSQVVYVKLSDKMVAESLWTQVPFKQLILGLVLHC